MADHNQGLVLQVGDFGMTPFHLEQRYENGPCNDALRPFPRLALIQHMRAGAD
jgi:hypothetical protein